MKILKFNESVDDDIYSLIDKLSGINTLIEDDLIDFKDKGHSLHEDEDGDVILQGEYNDIYSSISILNKLKGLNLDLVYADLTKTHFSYLISNPKRGEIIKKIMEYFLKNLKFKKDGKSSIKFSLDIDGGEDGIDIEIFDTSKVYITTGYDFMGSDIYRRSVFEIDDDFSKVPNKEEWISLINLVKDCIDYAKKNNIKI